MNCQQPIIRNPYRPARAVARRPRYACPEHGPLGAGEVDLDHRCTHCGRPILAIRKLRERHDSVALPRHDLQRVIEQCQCPHTTTALTELLEAYDAHL